MASQASAAATAAAIRPEITTPDSVGTRLGTLEYNDGAPSTQDHRQGV